MDMNTKRRMQSLIVRIVALPLLAAAVFFSYAWGVHLAAEIIRPSSIVAYWRALEGPQSAVLTLVLLSLIIPYLIVLAVLVSVFSYLAARIYRGAAVWAAAIATGPVLFVRVESMLGSEFSNSAALAVSVFEVLSFAVLMCLGTWLSSRSADRSGLMTSAR
jgi:hypothetical protein